MIVVTIVGLLASVAIPSFRTFQLRSRQAERTIVIETIRKAVEELFKVKVVRVNTMNMRGKLRRQRTHQAGKSADWKKAIVTLKKADKIILT